MWVVSLVAETRLSLFLLSRDPSFHKNLQKPRENGRLLKRTMIETNGKGINPWSPVNSSQTPKPGAGKWVTARRPTELTNASPSWPRQARSCRRRELSGPPHQEVGRVQEPFARSSSREVRISWYTLFSVEHILVGEPSQPKKGREGHYWET